MRLCILLAVFCALSNTNAKVYKLDDVDKGNAENMPPDVDNWEFLTYNSDAYVFLSTKEMPFVEADKGCEDLAKKFQNLNTEVFKDLEFSVLTPYGNQRKGMVEILNKIGLKKDVWNWADDKDAPTSCRVYKYCEDKKQYTLPETEEEMILSIPCDKSLPMLCGGFPH